MIFEAPKLLAADRRVIDKVDEVRRTLSYAVSQPLHWTGLLRRTVFARAIRGSNSIEGINVTLDDAMAAVEGDEPIDAEEKAWLAVVGYRTAMTYVLQLATDPHFTYSEGLIRALHFMMLKDEMTKNPGRWRPGPIFVRNDDRGEVVYEGPDAQSVPALTAELMNWLNNAKTTRTPTMVNAAMAHLNLTMIHPFSDGNGRMARCLQTLVLARDGILGAPFCSIEEYLGRNTQSYYNVLGEVGAGSWHPERDAHPWLRFTLTAHYRQAITLLRRQREMSRLWEALEAFVFRRQLPERTLLALADAAMGFRVRNSSYRAAAEVSENVASRDLKLLVDAGLLLAHGERRGRSYIASDEIQSIRKRTRENRPVEDDPYRLDDAEQGRLFERT